MREENKWREIRNIKQRSTLQLHFWISKQEFVKEIHKQKWKRQIASIKITVNSGIFNGKIIPRCQFCTKFKLVKFSYQSGKIIRKVILKIFIEKIRGTYITSVGKRLEPRFSVSSNSVADSSFDFDKNL